MTAQNKPSVEDRYRAQELAFEAMDASDPAQRQSLCDQALALDPSCVDALLLSDQVPDEPAKRIAYLEQVVRIAYDELGGEAFVKENRGYFWGLVETRPYMRARSYLAREYLEEHRMAEAVAEYEALLDLNPNDNQGLRYWLLGAYLEHGDLTGARALFKEYDKATAVFAWGQAMERFMAGDLGGAGRALATARRVNPHVETYATGRAKLPERLPEYYGDGDDREAQFCCFVLVPAWFANEEFLDWLASQPQKKTHVSVDEAGRNDPCPCGSGKKYKKCCYGKPVDTAPDLADSPQFPTVQHTAPGNTSAISESFFHGFRQFIGDREFESEEELQSLLEQYQQQVNQQPLANFHGLSPEQMQRLLYYPFDSPEVVEFPPILAEDPIGPLAELFSLLAAAIGTEGLKPTATGNLPRKVCREIALAHMGERQYAKFTEYRGINSEPDFPDLETTRFTAQEAGLIRKYKGRFILSRKCRDLMDKAGMRAVYQLLFRSYVRRVEWSAMDGYPQLGFLQDSFVFTLHLINFFGDQWRHNSFYVTEFLKAFPSLLSEIPPDTYSTPLEMLSSMYTIRCLERFTGYTGVAELKVTPGDVRMRDFKLRKAPLFDQVVKFHT